MKKLVVVLAVVALAGVGCAQDEEPTVQEPTSPAATETPAEVNDEGTATFTSEDVELEIELDNFYFKPTFIKLPGEATVKAELHNEGSATHTFTSDALGVDEELEPGAAKEVEISIGTKTRYEFYCRFHQDQGMRGAFQPH